MVRFRDVGRRGLVGAMRGQCWWVWGQVLLEAVPDVLATFAGIRCVEVLRRAAEDSCSMLRSVNGRRVFQDRSPVQCPARPVGAMEMGVGLWVARDPAGCAVVVDLRAGPPCGQPDQK